MIRLKRAYDPPSATDGTRVLVDRVWPRGLSKAKIKIEAWMRDLGPSTPLRQRFAHDPAKWPGFRARYLKELAKKRAVLASLRAGSRRRPLTLVYSARDPLHNQAVVIKEVLERGARGRR